MPNKPILFDSDVERYLCSLTLPFPSTGDLPNPGIKARSSALQADSLQSEPPGKPMNKALVQFSYLVLPNSLRPHGLQHASPPCPSPTPRVYSNSCPSSWWCHPTISSSVIPFSSSLQSFPAQGLFKWVSSLHQVAKLLEFQLQHQSFQWISRVDFL